MRTIPLRCPADWGPIDRTDSRPYRGQIFRGEIEWDSFLLAFILFSAAIIKKVVLRPFLYIGSMFAFSAPIVMLVSV